MIADEHPESEVVRQRIDELEQSWDNLKDLSDVYQKQLEISSQAKQVYLNFSHFVHGSYKFIYSISLISKQAWIEYLFFETWNRKSAVAKGQLIVFLRLVRRIWCMKCCIYQSNFIQNNFIQTSMKRFKEISSSLLVVYLKCSYCPFPVLLWRIRGWSVDEWTRTVYDGRW